MLVERDAIGLRRQCLQHFAQLAPRGESSGAQPKVLLDPRDDRLFPLHLDAAAGCRFHTRYQPVDGIRMFEHRRFDHQRSKGLDAARKLEVSVGRVLLRPAQRLLRCQPLRAGIRGKIGDPRERLKFHRDAIMLLEQGLDRAQLGELVLPPAQCIESLRDVVERGLRRLVGTIQRLPFVGRVCA